MYTGVPLWGSSQSQQERPSFVLFLARPSPQWFILHQFYSHLPLLHHSVFPMVPTLGFGRRCFFLLSFFSLSPCLLLFCIYLGIPDSSVYSHKSFVFFGRVSDTLVCLGKRLEGPWKDRSSRHRSYGKGCTERWWREGSGEARDA